MVTMVQSPVMAGYRTGAATRRRILGALLEREPRTVRGLALALGMDPTGVLRMLRRMERAGLVVIETGVSGQAGRVTLSAPGREAAIIIDAA